VYRCAAVHVGLVGPDGQRVGMEWLAGRKFFAFAGIGNPVALERQLRAAAGELVGARWLGDHHAYSREDVEAILREARGLGAEAVLTTAKDWVKVGRLIREGEAVMRIELGLRFSGADEAGLFEQVRSGLESGRP
jgi:tetraacyldisaccharide 4'-kinase